MVDTAILTAATGLIGSVIGASSSVATTWLAQRGQYRAQWQSQEATRRETLYTEFITEASKCLSDAMSRDPDGPEVLVGLYALIGRMRLKSSRPVVEAAERLMRHIVDAYIAPNLTFEQIRDTFLRDEVTDPLAEFGEACREELEGMRAL